MNPEVWNNLKAIEAIESSEELAEKHQYQSPFVSIVNLIKEFKI